MRYIRTNHNPLTVSDILLENGTARLEDFYPLTKVKTASDKKKLLSQGYNCNLRRTAATGAFASGHPAEPNGHLH